MLQATLSDRLFLDPFPLSEMLFAHLKRILELGRLRLRGPCGAIDEFLLAATAQNLRKLAKHCPAGYWLSQRARGIFPAPQQTTKVR